MSYGDLEHALALAVRAIAALIVVAAIVALWRKR
jgi:hypothetical protein